MVRVKLVIRNTHFTVKFIDRSLIRLTNYVEEALTTYKFIFDKRTRRARRTKDKSYSSFDPFQDEYRYHINMVKDFVGLLGREHIKREEISIKIDKEHRVEPINLELRVGFKPKDFQPKYIDALLDKSTGTNKLVDLRTGKGKGFISIYSTIQLNMRTAILVLPQYMQKWEDEILEYVDVDDDYICQIQGGNSLRELLTMEDPDFKFMIFSIRTIVLYIKDYLEDPSRCPVAPQDLFEHLNIGTMINDEAHQQTHAVFTALMFFNPKRYIALSATLDSNNKDVKKIYELYFPKKHRISNLVEFANYAYVHAVQYRMATTNGILFKTPQGYNHIMFEQSIMKNNILLRDYLDMIKHYAQEGYYKRRLKGEKLLIFAGSIRMCTVMTNFFGRLFQDLDVRRYVEDDPYENLMEADVCVTTNLSAGTAVDIPKLITVIQTVSIGSLTANIQALGRLREIPGRDVRYYYVYCKDIKNHVKLHSDRMQATRKLAKEYYLEEYQKELKVY